MRYLTYKNNHHNQQGPELFIENVAISNIAKAIPTPFYCYSKKNLIANFLDFKNSFDRHNISNYKICYAIKANCNMSLVKILANLGCGIDAVSAGEIDRAIKAGVKPNKIVFAGVGKTIAEIKFALSNGVLDFSVESKTEIFMLNQVANSLGLKARFLLRVNPDVDAKTHKNISTGKKGDKFGVDIQYAKDLYKIASQLPNIEIYGIAMHIGSQITKIEPFKQAFKKLRNLYLELKQEGYNIKNLDFGGGIGILYRDEDTISIDDYSSLIRDLTKDLNVSITIAPGRAIIGNVGILVTSVILLKSINNHKNFAIIDAAMNDLARPGLYDSYHETLPVIQKTGSSDIFDLAGPICESTDILAKNRQFTNLLQGDLITFLTAGAYGSSMSNQYNCRPLIPEILVDDIDFHIIRKRPNFDEMLHLEQYYQNILT